MTIINRLNPKCIRLVSFDFTNTLAMFASSAGDQYAKALAKEKIICHPESLNKSFFKKYPHHVKQYPFYGYHQGITCKGWWRDLFIQTLEDALKQDFRNVNIGVYNKVFDKLYFNFEMQPMPFAEEMLHGLRELKTIYNEPLCTIILTNNDLRCIDIVKSFNWHSYFDYIYVPSSLGKGKPDVDVFWEAIKMIENMKLLRAPLLPSQCLHVGNNYKDDYLAGKRAGLNVMLLKSEGEDGKDLVPENEYAMDLKHVLAFVTSNTSN